MANHSSWLTQDNSMPFIGKFLNLWQEGLDATFELNTRVLAKHMLFSGMGWDKPLISFNIIHHLTVFHMDLLNFGVVKQQLNKLSKTILLIRIMKTILIVSL